ncbi:uncharacterized protein LOC110773251 isoform X4 [Prunus avium]|uniref:Uncharacterized protein LOC110773251 isoform X4 n=1 Tax=Prunus avium TaxID=42229 RepID=A0A6P5U080_PRUAV|nr:uncharacterized protein LOC110773251 isoform X4 [Prunus avium]
MSSYNYNLYDEPIKATSESAEWIFFATNLGLAMLSAACDQASSPRKSHYALFGMLLAIAAVLISIWELIYRGKKERVVLRRWGMLWWFYHPPPVQYVDCLRHVDNPFKASLLPAIFLLCLGGSKLSNNRMNANTTDNNILRKPLDSQTIHVQDNKDSVENSSSTEETSKHATTKYYAPANIPSFDDQEVEGNIVGCRRVASREVLAGNGHVGGGWDEEMAEQVLQVAQEWKQWRSRGRLI